jgi:hypothetical protein
MAVYHTMRRSSNKTGLLLTVRSPWLRQVPGRSKPNAKSLREREMEPERRIYLGQFFATQSPNGSHVRLPTGRPQA